MGPFVTPFDLLFAICFLVSVAVLGSAVFQAARGRGRKALRMLGFWTVGAAIYFVVLISVSLGTPQKVLHAGQPRCYDDWCVTAEALDREVSGDVARITVQLQVHSRAGRVDQRAPDAAVFLLDSGGRRWDPVPDRAATPLGVLLHPGESVDTSRRFDVPAAAQGLGLVVNHGDGPGNFVIGDEASLWHKHTVYAVEP